MSVQLCPVSVYDPGGWNTHVCKRPVKRDGLCGVHARQKDQREQRNAKWVADHDESNTNQAAAVAALKRLGVEGTPAYDWTLAKYISGVTISIAELERIANHASP